MAAEGVTLLHATSLEQGRGSGGGCCRGVANGLRIDQLRQLARVAEALRTLPLTRK